MSIEIGLGAALKAAATMGASVGVIWGGLIAMDNRYEVKETHEVEHVVITTGLDNFSYTVLKKEIREIRDSLYNAPPDRKQQLELDLQDAIDRLCRQFPDDRECT